ALALEASRDEDPRLRRRGVEMLGAGDDPRTRAELEDRTKDVDAMVRALAIDGLSGWETVDGSILTRALGDAAAGVRLAAGEAIADGARALQLEQGLGPLEADPEPRVRHAVQRSRR